MRFSSSILILTPIYGQTERDSFPPLLSPCRYFFFRLMCRYTAPPIITRQSTMAKMAFSSTKNTSLYLRSDYIKNTGISKKADAQKYRQRYAPLPCRHPIDAGGKQGKNCLLYTSPSPRD